MQPDYGVKLVLLWYKRGNTVLNLALLDARAKLLLVRRDARYVRRGLILLGNTLQLKRWDDALVRAKLLALDKGR